MTTPEGDKPPVEKLPAQSQSIPGPTYANPNEDATTQGDDDGGRDEAGDDPDRD